LLSKILVGYDGSDCSKRGLALAMDIAEKYGASVTVINVVNLPVYGNLQDPFAVSADAAAINNDIRKTHENNLTRAVQDASKIHPKVTVTTELRDGNPATQIVTAASEGFFDLIVVGHGGEGRLRELILGSTSERVARSAKCPVLIVK
jgi:nucleotide-binding universal stress UspA family protein